MDLRPEDLFSALSQLSEQLGGDGSISGAINMAQTNLDDMDNEMVVQILLTSYNTMVQMALNEGLDTSAEGWYIPIFEGINLTFPLMGYTLKHTLVPRTQLNTVIHYAKILPTEMLRSPVHPLSLMEQVPREERGNIPESYTKLMDDSDYLPNIVNIHDFDPDGPNVLIISAQKVNLHFSAPPGQA